MAQVSVTIDAREYRLSCEDGQESYVLRLAAEIDQRIGDARQRYGEIGDNRLLVMAAMIVADELSEARVRLRRLEEELTALQDARVVAADRSKQSQAAIASALTTAAERIEGLSRRLNRTLPRGSGPGIG